MAYLVLTQFLLGTFASVGLITGSCDVSPQASKSGPPSIPQPAPSAGQREALAAALQLARSSATAEQAQLLERLRSQSFLDQLDTLDQRRRLPAERLQLAQVMEALTRNGAPAAQQTLIGLTNAPAFQTCLDCTELLLKAVKGMRPPPPEVLQWWERQTTADSVLTGLTMDVLCENGTPQAIAILEKRLADPQHDLDDKLHWLREPVLAHRHDVPLLRGMQRMLTNGALPAELQTRVVEALFDYRPHEWYNVDVPAIKPPATKTLSREAATIRQAIARYALAKVSLSAGLRSLVTKAAK